MSERAKQEYVSPYWFARIYANLGENDQAFEWLGTALDEGEGIPLQVDHDFDPLRDDPRFHDLRRRMNLMP